MHNLNKFLSKILLYLFVVFYVSCNKSNNSSTSEFSSYDYDHVLSDVSYEDDYDEPSGVFVNDMCFARVDCFNVESECFATYVLDIEVKNNKVTKIYFPNYGYLKDEHIWPDELNEYGFVRVEGDEGRFYDVQINY